MQKKRQCLQTSFIDERDWYFHPHHAKSIYNLSFIAFFFQRSFSELPYTLFFRQTWFLLPNSWTLCIWVLEFMNGWGLPSDWRNWIFNASKITRSNSVGPLYPFTLKLQKKKILTVFWVLAVKLKTRISRTEINPRKKKKRQKIPVGMILTLSSLVKFELC